MTARLGLRGRILLFFAAIALGALVSLGLGLWFGYHRQGSPDMFNAFVQGAVAAAFGILVLIAWIWFLFDTHVARPIEAIASAMRVRASADVSQDIDPADARYLGDLASAASLTTTSLANARNSLAQAVARETAQLASDKSKLEHLLGDVPPAVLMCTGRHHLVFYNSGARQMLSGPKIAVCLGRSLFDYLDDGTIREAHRRLIAAENPNGVVEFVCASHFGQGRLIGRMRLANDNDGDAAAYVMTLRDVSSEILAYARRDALLSDIFEHAEPNIAALSARLSGTGAQEQPAPSDADLRRELERLNATLKDFKQRFDACRADGWPMAATDSRELASALKRSLASSGIALDMQIDPVVIRCNAFDVTSLLQHLATRALGKETANMRLTIQRTGNAAQIALHWQGSIPRSDDLRRWLAEPVDGTPDGISAETILAAHSATIVVDTEGAGPSLNFTLRPIQLGPSVSLEPSRSVVYDFDLLSRIHSEKIADARLDDLTYVVFDTETTGLFPEKGDEVVQLAAVRLVRGKRVKGETFETLVNPGRPIPRSASDIHGVTDAMVAKAPTILEVVEQFHKFAEGAVLVAHNAPFDMEFLRRRERELGIRFVNPVLDTVLLSAVVFGPSQSHTLDALAERLAVPLSDTERHTAMGDTVATAEVFIKLKATLAARGIDRFGQVLSEVRLHGRLLKDLNGQTSES